MQTLPEHIIGLAKLPQKETEISPYENINSLREVIRESMHNAGLGVRDPDNPFADIVAPGMTVLLKPNWVLHFNKSGKGIDCMITHPMFVEAVIAEIVKAKPNKIIIGDAPIQSTIFQNIVTPRIAERFKRAAGCVDIDIRDFRFHICIPGRMTLCTVPNPHRSIRGILYDLGVDSLIEPLSHQSGSFRNIHYDHQTLNHRHYPGRHQYILCPEIIESDIIINLPKLKTHRKAGITAALKNMVGVNGDKDYLPHHRVGGSAMGGDCYEGRNRLKRTAEYCTDFANQHIDNFWEAPWRLGASTLLRLNHLFTGDNELEGSWYGNDTIWRMVLDLNRIVLYGAYDGVMADTRQRTVYSLTDAIMIGEGLGPLSPEPKYLGLISFAASSAFGDLIHSALMHFDWRKIPSIFHSFEKYRFPLTSEAPHSARACYNGIQYTAEDVALKLGIDCRPAPGWLHHIELNQEI
ncbi:MAG: DUF362 domain-containing protein [Methanoregulaceae archaeon]|jgi:uncharacterized protein (DUF362 family)